MTLSEISKKFYKISLKDEEMVMNLTQKRWGGQVRRATRSEDIKDHIDFFWRKSMTHDEIGFDVKGLRKNNRSDSNFDDTMTWIELLNVQGNPGSIYGKAKYMAFITNTSVLYVPRENIINFVNEKITGKDTVYKCPYEFYTPYRRNGRKDLIVKVSMEDLRLFKKQELFFDCFGEQEFFSTFDS